MEIQVALSTIAAVSPCLSGFNVNIRPRATGGRVGGGPFSPFARSILLFSIVFLKHRGYDSEARRIDQTLGA
jgi:hypothetical protein